MSEIGYVGKYRLRNGTDFPFYGLEKDRRKFILILTNGWELREPEAFRCGLMHGT